MTDRKANNSLPAWLGLDTSAVGVDARQKTTTRASDDKQKRQVGLGRKVRTASRTYTRKLISSQKKQADLEPKVLGALLLAKSTPALFCIRRSGACERAAFSSSRA